MILSMGGVVLSRRPFGENDRLCVLFTENLGKVPVRFVGVNRPAGKLKALSEPGVWGEYRLYLSPRSELAKAVGGRLTASFPRVREDLGRTLDALFCLELLDRLTPDRLPSPEKYRLLCAVLAALEESPSPWLALSFGLRLVELAGVSLRERAPRAAAGVWAELHDAEPAALSLLTFDPAVEAEAREMLETHAAAQLGRPLRGALVRRACLVRSLEGVPA